MSNGNGGFNRYTDEPEPRPGVSEVEDAAAMPERSRVGEFMAAAMSEQDPDLDKASTATFDEGGYIRRGIQLGRLVTEKQRQYGRSAERSTLIMKNLYPDGIQPHQYGDVLLVVRVLDKLSRIAQRGEDGQDLGGETPWKDLAGYSLLGWEKDDAEASDGQ